MLHNLTLTNVKGISGSWSLSPITLFVGANSRGKSACADAIAVSLLGYLPSLGKQHQATWALSSGPTMSVATDRSSFTWRLDKGKVVCKSPENFVPVPESSLDLGAFFSRTSAERLSAILAACHVQEGGLNTQNVLARVNSMAPSMPPFFWKDDVGLVEVIELAGKHLKKWKSDLTAVVKETSSSVASLTDQLSASTAQQSVEAALREATKVHSEAGSRLSMLKQQLREREDINGRLASIKFSDPIDLQNQIDAFQKALPEAAAGATARQKQSAALAQQEVGKWRAAVQMLDERKKKVAENQSCPTCGQGIGADAIESVDSDLTKAMVELEKALKEQATTAATVRKADSDAKAANQTREVAERQISTLKGQLSGLQQAKNLEVSLIGRLQTLATEEMVGAMELNVAQALAELTELQDQQKLWLSQQTLRNNTRELQAKLGKQESDLQEAKNAIDALAEMRDRLINDVVGSLLEVANKVVLPVLGRPLGWSDGDFVLGRATLGTLSGSERMIVYLGLQIALSASHEPKIVVVDELGVADATRKAQLLHVVAGLIEDGTLSQFFAADITPPSNLPACATVITL